MRRPAIRLNRGRASITKTRPAPVRGWNARDAIAAMDPSFAVTMDNMWPLAADVMLRKGSADHVTGIGGGTAEVETLATYRPASGSQVLFAWAGTSAYNASSAGAVGAAVLSALTNARWQTINFRTIGGHFLLCVNGADDLRSYDGATWTAINGGSTPAITGLTTSTIINIHAHKERVWYIPTNSMSVYYTAAGAFAGAVTALPLGAVFKKGGYLVAMGTWTLDGGDGSDDLAVFVTSEGEIAVYQGTDPASSSTWAKVGLFTIGTPIGRRCLMQLGGDLLIITTDGVIPCSKLAIANQNKTVAMTDNIQTAMADAVQSYGTSFGWSATLYPGGTMMILNVPVASGSQQQFVMNTVTRAWARFKPLGNNPGWPAWCFEVLNGELYFGTTGKVRKAWTGFTDATLAIEGELQTAFDFYGDSTRQKEPTLCRPVIGWDSDPEQILIGVDVDYIVNTPTSLVTLPSAAGGTWDSSAWDSGIWGGSLNYSRDWYGIEASVGFALSFHMRVKSSRGTVHLAANAISYLPGSSFG
jgi:hypothetical protein